MFLDIKERAQKAKDAEALKRQVKAIEDKAGILRVWRETFILKLAEVLEVPPFHAAFYRAAESAPEPFRMEIVNAQECMVIELDGILFGMYQADGCAIVIDLIPANPQRGRMLDEYVQFQRVFNIANLGEIIEQRAARSQHA